MPGNGGESEEGPLGAREEKFMANAGPDGQLPLARLNGARAAFGQLARRGAGRDKNTPGARKLYAATHGLGAWWLTLP